MSSRPLFLVVAVLLLSCSLLAVLALRCVSVVKDWCSECCDGELCLSWCRCLQQVNQWCEDDVIVCNCVSWCYCMNCRAVACCCGCYFNGVLWRSRSLRRLPTSKSSPCDCSSLSSSTVSTPPSIVSVIAASDAGDRWHFGGDCGPMFVVS